MQARNQTPLRCPVCDGELADTRVRHIGDVTALMLWQIHAGRCPEHGWFQAEVISKPPSEIFPVNRLGGIARRVEVNGRDVYAFPTVWHAMNPHQEVDPLDPDLWKIDWQQLRVQSLVDETA